MAIKPIEILINAKDNASGVFGSLQAKVATVGAAIAGYFGIKAFAGVVQGAAEFEQGLSRVQAATGATADEMARLRKTAEDAGANTKFTSTEAAAALENLAKAGLSAGDAIDTLPAVMALAQAGDIALATSAEYVTKAVMGMGLEFTDAARVADVLAKGANATNTSVEGLAQALSYAAPTANSLGVSLESTVAIIGKFADAGIDASRAGTALNAIMSQFADPASKFRNELAAIGITTGDFNQALASLAASGAKGSKAINAVGLEAGPALKALLNQGIPALNELRLALEGSAGSAAATAKVMQDNLNGSLTGLSSAWETVKNTLGTPVLPVLKEGVEQLAGAFRAAVSDGTVQKFGEAIATAFQAGLKWVREFLAQVDFAAVLVRLQEFADGAKERFDQFGQYATNAGAIVQTAYGVMSAGVNAVLTAIYGLGIAFTETAAGIVRVAANISEALSKIAIGSAKDRLINEAAQMREVLQGLTGVSEEFGKKANAALDATTQGAQTARNGFTQLTTGVQETSAAATASAQAFDDMGKRLEEVRQKTATAKKATTDKTAADESARVALADLRAEYAALVAKGDLQAAAEKIEEINRALRGTPAAAQEAAAEVEGAFKNLGMSTTKDLNEAASKTEAAWATLTANGVKSAAVLRDAFAAYANAAMAAAERQGDAAVAATRSVLEAKAAAAGLTLELEQGGKIVVKSMQDAEEATRRVGRAAEGAAGGFRGMGKSAAEAAAEIDKFNARYGQSNADREAKYGPVGSTPSRVGKSRDTTFVTVNQADVNQAIAKRYGDAAVGNQTAEAAYASRLQYESYQRNYGNAARSQESLNQQRNYGAEIERLERKLAEELGKNSAPTRPGGGGGTGTPPGATVVNINLDGRSGSVTTDSAGAQVLQDVLRELSNARRVSVR